ncbi:hypothetical protein BSI_31340 [Bacillus inaquosorum KCTC 13429]|uniref:Uncharacterized protein n=1 Tax=Bacillus inaquosorum KCTC 13429 TaxID=1236548 RepID=A0A9W5PBW5_9BACI|nr:hypothetical protein BSI_31340 [Bacillus inaquosorum KCTC 13429]
MSNNEKILPNKLNRSQWILTGQSKGLPENPTGRVRLIFQL